MTFQLEGLGFIPPLDPVSLPKWWPIVGSKPVFSEVYFMVWLIKETNDNIGKILGQKLMRYTVCLNLFQFLVILSTRVAYLAPTAE